MQHGALPLHSCSHNFIMVWNFSPRSRTNLLRMLSGPWGRGCYLDPMHALAARFPHDYLGRRWPKSGPHLTAILPSWKPVLAWPEMAKFAIFRETPLAISELPAGRYGMLPHSCPQQKANGGRSGEHTSCYGLSSISATGRKRCGEPGDGTDVQNILCPTIPI